MGIQAMVTSYKNNSIRKKKPTYFESTDLKKTTFRGIRKRKATQEELKAVESKIKYQNRIENIIYGSVTLMVIGITWSVFF